MYLEVNMGETQRFNVKSNEVLDRVKQLIHEGNVRRVRLLHDEKTIIEIPLTVGAPVAVVGILAAPLLAAIGAFAALVTECTIEVEKVEDK
jgi:DNA-binding Lrp family transcriptional regulator